MKVAIAVDYTGSGMRGGDVYVQGLSSALARVDPGGEYRLFGYFFRDAAAKAAAIPCPEAPNFRRLIKRWPQALVDAAEGLGIPVVESALRAEGCSLYHAPGARLPVLRRMRSVVSVHDLIPFARPDLAPSSSLELWRSRSRRAITRATRVLASSTATKQDIVQYLGVPDSRVDVAILGVDRDVFRPVEDAGQLARVRERYRLPERFLLSAGPYEPRRNWEALLWAARQNQQDGALGVVLTGAVAGEHAARVRKAIEESGMGERTVLTGHVPRADLAALYTMAAAFVYPTLYDGFNLPVIEAMACGAPVVASTAGALPEICGGAALLVDPRDVESVAEGVRAALGSAGAGLREKGAARAAELSWERTARATLETYRRALA